MTPNVEVLKAQYEKPKKVEHTLLVATELTTEDMLEIFINLARKLTRERDEALEWKGSFEMYVNAWERELKPFGFLSVHKHHIDSMVITTREVVRRAVQHQITENSRLNRDPFWDVPDYSKEQL